MASNMLKGKGGAFAYGGLVVLIVMAVALSALSGYIDNKLRQNGEQQATTFTEQMGSFVGEKVEDIQNAIGAFTIQSDDPALVQPALAALRDRFGFYGVAFARMDGTGVTAGGESFDVAQLGDEEVALSQGVPGYSESFQTPDGVYARLAQEPLYLDGRQAGALYVVIPLTAFSTDAAEVTKGVIGDTLLFDGRTGEVLLNFGETATADEGSSVYDFVGGALAAAARAPGKNSQAPTEELDALRRAVLAGRSALVVGSVNGRESYLCVSPTGRGSWYVCNVISVEAVRAEASVVSAVFTTVFALSGACVLLGVGVAVALYRKQARERDVEMKQHLYQALSDSLDFGVALYSPSDGVVTPIVAKSADIFGIGFDELVSDPRKAEDLGFSEQGCTLLRRIQADDIHFFEHGEFCLSHPSSGRARYVEYTVRPLRYEGKGQVLVIMRDVTEANLIQLSMKDAMESAEAANRAKSEFLSRMSHEIRTPMNVIIGKLHLARRHRDDPERMARSLDDIERASDHLLELINGVLDISKIESGKVNFVDRPFNLARLLDSLAAVVEPQCAAKGQTYRLVTEGPVDALFVGDELRMRQLLVNLLTNAVKYTEEGGHVTLEVRVAPSLAAGYESITLVVSDDGIGMAPEFVEHLFEPFVMEGRSRSEGTGLGMPIVKHIVNSMGGDIHVETAVGRGTTYTIVVNKKMLTEGERDGLAPRGAEGAAMVAGAEVVEDAAAAAGAEAAEAATAIPAAPRSSRAPVPQEAAPAADPAGSSDPARAASDGCAPAVPRPGAGGPAVAPAARSAASAGTVALTPDPAASPTPGPAAPAPGPAGPVEAFDFAGVRVLLAEDSDLNAEIATELLSEEGMVVDWAEDGQAACDMFAASALGFYDVVLMDVRMPRKTGLEATAAIRAMGRPDAATVPIIAMSANAFADDVLASLKSGMNAHLSKPINLAEVLATIAREVSARR